MSILSRTNFEREWTQFMLDAEVDSFGTARLCWVLDLETVEQEEAI